MRNKEIVLSNLYHMITMAMAINLFNRSVDKKNLAKEVQTTIIRGQGVPLLLPIAVTGISKIYFLLLVINKRHGRLVP